jgi:hypothetical protein
MYAVSMGGENIASDVIAQVFQYTNRGILD